MDKKEFLNMFKDEEKITAAAVYEKMEKCYRSGAEVYSDEFIKREIANKLLPVAVKAGVKAELFGFFEDAERNIIGFSENGIDYPEIKLLIIKCKTKFRELKHSDFLGSLMALGFKREKFGDLVLKNGVCYTPCNEKTAEYIYENLKQVSTTPCKVEIKEYLEIEPVAADFEEKLILAASFRADALISEICNISRKEAEDIIFAGNLKVNHSEVKEKSHIIKENSIISIKKYGKYKIEAAIGESKSGKLRIKCRKYI